MPPNRKKKSKTTSLRVLTSASTGPNSNVQTISSTALLNTLSPTNTVSTNAVSFNSTTASLIPLLTTNSYAMTQAALNSSMAYLKAISLKGVMARVSNAAAAMNNVITTASDVASYLKPFLLPDFDDEFNLDFKEKKPRHVTSFASNITASLKLPKNIGDRANSITLSNQTSSQSIFTTVWNSFYYFFRSPSPKVVVKEVNTTATETASKTSVRDVMEALEATLKTLTDPIAIDHIHLQKVELVAEQIKEHAARRVDLFFYLLLAVYRKHVEVKKTSTVKQHGQGSEKAGTHACHCSLFPNVQLIPIQQNAKHTTFIGKHFEDTLNITTELPMIVNHFDIRMERVQGAALVEHLLSILNKAATNKLEPRAAMNLFFKAMDHYFSYFDKLIQKVKIENPLALKKVWEYQKEGTFWAANQDLTVRNEYVYMMLRMKKEEIKNLRFGMLLPFYKGIQHEIYMSKQSKPEHRHKKKKPK